MAVKTTLLIMFLPFAILLLISCATSGSSDTGMVAADSFQAEPARQDYIYRSPSPKVIRSLGL